MAAQRLRRIRLAIVAPALLAAAAGLRGLRPVWVPTCADKPAPPASWSLEEDCRHMAGWVERMLGPDCRAIVHPPLVVAGDVPKAELERQYRETLQPLARTLRSTWFDASPDRPVTILLLADADRYACQARSQTGRETVSPQGHYRPHLRLVVVNAAQGVRPLRHELTHALMDFDFPDAPPWLQEGMASLEETEGKPGPRLATLAKAMQEDRVGTLRSLVRGDFRKGSAPLRYAHACALCLYLQQRGLLGTFYRRLRDDRPNDASGERTLLALLAAGWPAIETEFRHWVAAHRPGKEPITTSASTNVSSPINQHRVSP